MTPTTVRPPKKANAFKPEVMDQSRAAGVSTSDSIALVGSGSEDLAALRSGTRPRLLGAGAGCDIPRGVHVLPRVAIYFQLALYLLHLLHVWQ